MIPELFKCCQSVVHITKFKWCQVLSSNADTAGIVNKLSPEPPVNHWRHMGAIAWTKLISNLHSARTIWCSSIWIAFHRCIFGQKKESFSSKMLIHHIHFLNPECVRIPWILAPKNFPLQNFRVRSVLQKSSIFHWFLLPPQKKKVSGLCTHNFDARHLPNS